MVGLLINTGFNKRLKLKRKSIKPHENGCNVVGCYMFRPFAHPVTCCCMLLRVVAQSLKPVKILVVANGATTPSNTQQQVTDYWQKIFVKGGKRQSADSWPTVGQLSADCWPTVDQQSADSFLEELFFTFSQLSTMLGVVGQQ